LFWKVACSEVKECREGVYRKLENFLKFYLLQDSCSAQLTTGGCRLIFSPEADFPNSNLCCQYTGCAWRRHPGLQSNAVNVYRLSCQGTLGYKVMLSTFGVLLVMVTRMDVLMCFRAGIPRVHVGPSEYALTWGRAVSCVGMDPGVYCTWG